MPTRTLTPAEAGRLDGIAAIAIAALEPNSFDAQLVAQQNGRIRWISLLYNRAGTQIGWHASICEQVTALKLGDQPVRLEHHGQARHYGRWRAWEAGARRSTTYHWFISQQAWVNGGSSADPRPPSCSCHTPTGAIKGAGMAARKP